MYPKPSTINTLSGYLKDPPASADEHVFLNYQGAGLSQQGVADIVEKYRRGSRKSLAAIPCATYKASKGYTMSELQELLGYERPGTSLIYTHMARDPRQLMMQTGL